MLHGELQGIFHLLSHLHTVLPSVCHLQGAGSGCEEVDEKSASHHLSHVVVHSPLRCHCYSFLLLLSRSIPFLCK